MLLQQILSKNYKCLIMPFSISHFIKCIYKFYIPFHIFPQQRAEYQAQSSTCKVFKVYTVDEKNSAVFHVPFNIFPQYRAEHQAQFMCHSMWSMCHSMWSMCHSMYSMSYSIWSMCHSMYFMSYSMWSMCHSIQSIQINLGRVKYWDLLHYFRTSCICLFTVYIRHCQQRDPYPFLFGSPAGYACVQHYHTMTKPLWIPCQSVACCVCHCSRPYNFDDQFHQH